MTDQPNPMKGWKLDFDSLSVEKKHNFDPPGYDASIAKEANSAISVVKKKDSSLAGKKQQMLYAMATAPAKNVAFMCFMAYMFGNGIQIFSIIMTFSLLAQPFSAILSSGEMFKADAEFKLDTLTPRLLYCLVHSGQIVFGLYKLNAMGLLPVHASDWISTMEVPRAMEQSFMPFN
jgi:hypothetical protein